jgi:hypothetical protein
LFFGGSWMSESSDVPLEDENNKPEKTSCYKERRRQNNPLRKRHGARNQDKSKVFVKWLTETFPHAFADDRPILDVAGGKGEVAARLCVCHRRHVIMVDPRLADPHACFLSTVLNKLPLKWRQRIQEQDPRSLEQLFATKFSQFETYFDTTTLQHQPELQRAVVSSSLLIGLHADGATEAIVQAALDYSKPFVVVPCCVFPNLFPQRTIRQGDNLVPVRTVESFCQYLLEKDERFKMTQLPFDGRNIAIYWDGLS